jgi:hypothetical protein
LGVPAALKKDVGPFYDLWGQPVIEVVVHLCDELIVGK